MKRDFFLIVGAISFLGFIIAGFKMVNIESVSGNTVAEVYYNAMGFFSFGMAFLSGGFFAGLYHLLVNTEPFKNSEKTIEGKGVSL